jgi:hypothetical protein
LNHALAVLAQILSHSATQRVAPGAGRGYGPKASVCAIGINCGVWEKGALKVQKPPDWPSPPTNWRNCLVERAKAALFVAYMAWVFAWPVSWTVAAMAVHTPQWLMLGAEWVDTVFAAVGAVIGLMLLGAWVYVALEKRRRPRQ